VEREIIIIGGLITFGIFLGLTVAIWASRFGGVVHRRRRPPSSRLAGVEERLSRLEDSVNTVAIEMERIAEAHRFTARILTDRLEALPAHRPLERPITPH
jgi:hypothetical protein